ncbi:sensor histidine kinase [Cellulomonas soli]|uniref:histidine kinase n=1 Tax=Cellulomonas soli TaxID=931535 RepID=A0A512PGA5_9CELL|nr:HAMP domain-containing sensor histidine kinase [Cellulomonas soli]NYI58091.1 two-component system OmpR family sensor kinase [Cellulomonas soli]GEP70226.1 two-component sensor histidine kinase [Cellulomonas soli]
MSEAAGSSPRRARRSIRARLVVGLVAVLLAALVGAGVVSVVALRRILVEHADERVTAALDVVLARADPPGGTLAETALRTLVPDDTIVAAAQGDVVVMAVAGGRTTAPQDLTGVVDVEAGAAPVGVRWDGKPVRVGAVATPGLTIRLDPAGGGGDIQVDRVLVAVDVAQDREVVARLMVVEAFAGLALLGLATALAAGVVHRGLGPVRTLAAAARAVGEGVPGAVLPLDQPDAETHELAVALQEALRRRTDAEDRVRAFVQDASHELRTPLTIVHGWADLYLQGGLDGDRLDRAMVRVEAETTRMRHLVDQMALLARLDEDVPLRRDRLDLADVVREVADDLRVVAPERDVRIDTEPAPLLGDRERLLQVVHNLVGNAVRHTPAGTTVRVEVRRVDGVVRLDVVDDGPGIPPEVRERVFDRFARGDGASSGSGLGLAVVRAVVGGHHGTVGLLEAGTGTHVRVTLPST